MVTPIITSGNGMKCVGWDIADVVAVAFSHYGSPCGYLGCSSSLTFPTVLCSTSLSVVMLLTRNAWGPHLGAYYLCWAPTDISQMGTSLVPNSPLWFSLGLQDALQLQPSENFGKKKKKTLLTSPRGYSARSRTTRWAPGGNKDPQLCVYWSRGCGI